MGDIIPALRRWRKDSTGQPGLTGKPGERYCLKKRKGKVMRNITQGWPVASIDMHIHIHMHLQTHAHMEHLYMFISKDAFISISLYGMHTNTLHLDIYIWSFMPTLYSLPKWQWPHRQGMTSSSHHQKISSLWQIPTPGATAAQQISPSALHSMKTNWPHWPPHPHTKL